MEIKIPSYITQNFLLHKNPELRNDTLSSFRALIRRNIKGAYAGLLIEFENQTWLKCWTAALLTPFTNFIYKRKKKTNL